MKTITLSVDVLNKLDMSKLPTYPHLSRTTLAQLPDGTMLESLSLETNNNFSRPAGNQHYRLLAYIASCIDGIQISDIGTSSGGSAMALASNQNNIIYSVDRVNCRTKDYSAVQNVRFDVGSFYDSSIMDNIVKSKIILLDIQHEGPDEVYFYNELVRRNWKGMLICDDITLNPNMIRFWNDIELPKMNVTKYGHGDNGSGTGIVLFGSDFFVELT